MNSVDNNHLRTREELLQDCQRGFMNGSFRGRREGERGYRGTVDLLWVQDSVKLRLLLLFLPSENSM